jgi:delta 1-pyrroline-5-carboxylate dehydrogenase
VRGAVLPRHAGQLPGAHIGRGEAAGATLITDGRGAGSGGGFFVGPTLFDNITTDMDIYQDEIFGPVLAVVRVNSAQEGIDLINRNPYGNETCIFTNSGSAARKFQRDVHAGMVGHQRAGAGADGVLLVRRLEGVVVRRQAHPRSRGHQVLHPRQGGHRALAPARRAEEHAGHMHFPVAV